MFPVIENTCLPGVVRWGTSGEFCTLCTSIFVFLLSSFHLTKLHVTISCFCFPFSFSRKYGTLREDYFHSLYLNEILNECPYLI